MENRIKKELQRARVIYGIVFSVFTVFVGALFIWQVWAIYRSAESKPFSVDSISAHFKQIQVFVWLWVATLIGNLLFGILYPDQKKKSGFIDLDAQVQKMRARLPDSGKFVLKNKTYPLIRKIVFSCGCAVLLAVIIASAYFLSAAYTPTLSSKFFAESNGAAERLLCLFAWVCFGAILLAVAAVIDNVLVKKELALLKDSVAMEAKAKQGKGGGIKENLTAEELKAYNQVCVEVAEERKNKKVRREDLAADKNKKLAVWIARGVLACAAVVLLIVGIANGGMADVLEKAKNICTQCIGLG